MRVQKHSIPNFGVPSVWLLAALIMGAAGAVRAQTAPSPMENHTPPAHIATAGTSGTIPPNTITNRELDAAFNRADTNHDGRLTRQEAERFPALEQRFEQIDSNHDSFISRDEFIKAAGS
ncbi:EF-hand domain-containing protein [Polaromonas sp. SM01]|uniref:EF-hand domain-containing protein n=1 Tax=Polaromonas sp. SM01 TaxID=3085630 RepID=UPI002980C3C7|nr:EF-hand domain-containing protein [Polaromonas sp. SM01]MDW5441328.1 EF-hand domain-containing protein [Polaromonas sp. SM01]